MESIENIKNIEFMKTNALQWLELVFMNFPEIKIDEDVNYFPSGRGGSRWYGYGFKFKFDGQEYAVQFPTQSLGLAWLNSTNINDLAKQPAIMRIRIDGEIIDEFELPKSILKTLHTKRATQLIGHVVQAQMMAAKTQS
jgi:hypothetical protein